MYSAEETIVMDVRSSWTTEDIIPAEFIEGLICEARSIRMRDTEWYDDFGDTAWLCCKSPCCYRCSLIDATEMDLLQEGEKGITVEYIGGLRNTEAWREMDMAQRIGKSDNSWYRTGTRDRS